MNQQTFTSFHPAPWCFNGHAHTILPSLLFNSPILHSTSIKIATPDNDFVEADLIDKATNSPFVVLFHGLEGNSRRYYITRLANHLNLKGFSVLAVNFRSCGNELNRQRRFYHSGETEDVATIFKWVNHTFPNRALFATGFSLGASVLLNFLKQEGSNNPLSAAAVVSTPFDLKKGSLNLDRGINRIYSKRFLITLEQKLNEKRKIYSDLPDFTGSTIYEFDDQVTAPIHGFTGAEDYYFRCSSGFFMDKIKTDTLVIHSNDDPLCPFKWTPVTDIQNNPKLKPLYTREGGHVGFWSLPPGWLNHSIGKYFQSFL